ncbi:hypothetical protein SELMODRAFT_419519 [Selaginella moellendorffii]|uniref:Uncharacterized protein n=1 Tax=Selaginella moellendorffii TaxID=88036 RepID=D8S974_SELML|nr:hypothetical protein SELMODRAFT_419519 [Selaginella moellendorffii]
MKKDTKLPRAFDEGLYNEMSLWMTRSRANVPNSHRVNTSMGSTIANKSPGYEINATADPNLDVIFETQDPRDANEDIPKAQVSGKKVPIATGKKCKCILKGSDDRRVAMMLQGTHMMCEELRLLRQAFVESIVTKENVLEFWGFARLVFLMAMASLCGSVAFKAVKLAKAAVPVVAKKARTGTADREEAWILKIMLVHDITITLDQEQVVITRDLAKGSNRWMDGSINHKARAPSLNTDNHQRELNINHQLESVSPLLCSPFF